MKTALPFYPRLKIFTWLALGSLMLIAVACNSQSKPAYEVVKPAEITLGSPLPAPAKEGILTISGALTNKNVADTLVLDMSTIEKLGLVKYTVIKDPWENKQVTYTGVLLADLLKAAGAAETATSVHFTALDDYQVDIVIAKTKEVPILLATQADGQYMDVDHAGPTRIVFPYDSFSEIDLLDYKNLSIWNISSMEIK
jgi:hypothetical protein